MTHSSRCPYLCIQGLGPFLKSPCLWSLCILTKLLRIISGPSRWVFHLPPPSSKCSHNSLGFHCPTQASPTHRTRPCPLLVTWGKSLMHRCLTPLIYDSSLRPAAPKDEIFLFHHSTLSTHMTGHVGPKSCTSVRGLGSLPGFAWPDTLPPRPQCWA